MYECMCGYMRVVDASAGLCMRGGERLGERVGGSGVYVCVCGRMSYCMCMSACLCPCSRPKAYPLAISLIDICTKIFYVLMLILLAVLGLCHHIWETSFKLKVVLMVRFDQID